MKTRVHYEVEAFVPDGYEIKGVVFIENGCCPAKPVLLTRGTNKKHMFSCQCACGMWCTSGFDTASEAIADFERMTEEAE